MAHDLRVEMRLRNNVLWHAIFGKYPSVAAFCRAHELPQGSVGNLLNLTCRPRSKLEPFGYRRLPLRVAEAVGMLPEDLFPDHLYGIERTSASIEVDGSMRLEIQDLAALPGPVPSPEDLAIEHERNERLLHELSRFPFRQREMICLRYGLKDRPECTVQEISDIFRLSRERVKQIIEKTVRTLYERRKRILDPSDACRRGIDTPEGP